MITPSEHEVMVELTDALNKNTAVMKRLEVEVRRLTAVLGELLKRLDDARKPW